MTVVFLKLLNMSIMATWLVLAVLLLRPLWSKAPKWIPCLLWGMVALRLLLPVTVESSLSLIPSTQVIPVDIAQTETPAIYSGIPQINSAVNPALLQSTTQPGMLDAVVRVVTWIWFAGACLMLLYSAVSYLVLKLRLRVCLHYEGRIYLCDGISSPFVLGMLFPRIYIPSDMDEKTLKYVLSHETAHIRRGDHLWKPLGYLLLSLYWFNPLLWVAYVLLCRDIERACDEKVLKSLGQEEKQNYATALLNCSVHRRLILTCPVAFGEVGVKARIKGILRYKKPLIWLTVVFLLLSVLFAACFLTSPKACAHSYDAQITQAPSCTHKGVQTQTCSLCEHLYVQYVDALPHTLTEPVVEKAPTCTATGLATSTCTHCGGAFSQQLPRVADAHNMVQTELVEATCANEGVQTFTCTDCGYIKQQTQPRLTHTYTKKTVRKATCTKEGLLEYCCSLCGDTYQKKTAKTDHRGLVYLYYNGYTYSWVTECFECAGRFYKPANIRN